MADVATQAKEPRQSEAEAKITVAKLPLSSRLYHAAWVFAIQMLLLPPARAVGNVYEFFYPPENRPDQVKTYSCRPRLPVRYVADPIVFVLLTHQTCVLIRVWR